MHNTCDCSSGFHVARDLLYLKLFSRQPDDYFSPINTKHHTMFVLQLYKCISARTGASTPKNSPLIIGRFWAYAILSRSSNVFAHTILPSADETTTPPQLQQQYSADCDITALNSSLQTEHDGVTVVVTAKRFSPVDNRLAVCQHVAEYTVEQGHDQFLQCLVAKQHTLPSIRSCRFTSLFIFYHVQPLCRTSTKRQPCPTTASTG